MKTKAQASSLSQMLIGLVAIGLVGLLVFFFITRSQRVRVIVEENEIVRRKLILTNVLLSSDKIACSVEFDYSDDIGIHRGVLDAEKLDLLLSDPSLVTSLKQEISYSVDYSINVTDLEADKEWIIGNEFKPAFQLPVSIKYPLGEIHVGLLSVNFEGDIVTPPQPLSPEPTPDNKKIDDFLSSMSEGESPLIGLSSCISSASATSGIPITVFYAIPINEGGWKGTALQKGECLVSLGNPVGKQSNNLYSIKGSGCSWGTWECYSEGTFNIDSCNIVKFPNEEGNDCDDLYYCAITADFKSYSTKCDSVNDFTNKVTTSSRYKDCLKDDAKEFVQCLQEGGYATDPNWSNSVGSIIDRIQPYLS